ncbi:MAG: hypothetical protein WCV58_03780 [Patescibacteria group bacterium]|jgi:hypothetical protein
MRAILAEVPIVEIDNALKAIVYAGVSVESLDWLICRTNQTRTDAYQTAVDCVVYEILEAIKEDAIARWDFDVKDTTHLQKSVQRKTTLPTNWNPPRNWLDHEKREILYGIIGCYRVMCHRMIESFVYRFSQAGNCHETQMLKEEAFACSILLDTDAGIQNNHSIIDSQKVLFAYWQTLSRLKRVERHVFWPIFEEGTESIFQFTGN